jgi:hypothetical protein
VIGIDEINVAKKSFENNPGGIRILGKFRLTWLEDAENCLREHKMKTWRQKAINRKDWASLAKETKERVCVHMCAPVNN